ncbi:MAG: ISAs1 family transposase [Lachnospiraceae bacterium]|nr:ISAs1 family transposase [Lachnospiraceae bacterium]
MVCGGEDFASMEEFGKSHKEFLAKFLELPNEIPDSDTFRRVFEKINASGLSSCLVNWIPAERGKRSVVAIDGKTMRGSANKQHKAYHVASAFVAGTQITLGEINVEEKTNEKGHGRIEKREYRLLTDISWPEQGKEWCGLKALGMVNPAITENGGSHEYTRYFITSLTDINEVVYWQKKLS